MADVRAYYRMDVGYFENPKIAPILDARPRAVILHQRAIAYAAQHLTDGVVPLGLVARMVAASWCGGPVGQCVSLCGSHNGSQCGPECEALCDVCLLVQSDLLTGVEGGSGTVHDYLEHNRSAEDAQKAKTAGQKGARARWDAKANTDRIASRSADRSADPNGQRERENIYIVREDVADLCETLASLIEANGSKRPNVGKRWQDSARLLLDTDGRPLAEAKAVMRWSQQDEFWKSNILSMSKFREKYDQLRLRAQQQGQTVPLSPDGQPLPLWPGIPSSDEIAAARGWSPACPECERPNGKHFKTCSKWTEVESR